MPLVRDQARRGPAILATIIKQAPDASPAQLEAWLGCSRRSVQVWLAMLRDAGVLLNQAGRSWIDQAALRTWLGDDVPHSQLPAELLGAASVHVLTAAARLYGEAQRRRRFTPSGRVLARDLGCSRSTIDDARRLLVDRRLVGVSWLRIVESQGRRTNVRRMVPTPCVWSWGVGVCSERATPIEVHTNQRRQGRAGPQDGQQQSLERVQGLVAGIVAGQLWQPTDRDADARERILALSPTMLAATPAEAIDQILRTAGYLAPPTTADPRHVARCAQKRRRIAVAASRSVRPGDYLQAMHEAARSDRVRQIGAVAVHRLRIVMRSHAQRFRPTQDRRIQTLLGNAAAAAVDGAWRYVAKYAGELQQLGAWDVEAIADASGVPAATIVHGVRGVA